MAEAIVASVIGVIAVLGLAHSFGLGRALIDRYEIARAALGVAQARIETLSVLPPESPSLVPGVYQQPFAYEGRNVGTETWTIAWRDDPADGLGGADADSDTTDIKKVSVEVRWSGATGDVIRLSSLLPR